MHRMGEGNSHLVENGRGTVKEWSKNKEGEHGKAGRALATTPGQSLEMPQCETC